MQLNFCKKVNRAVCLFAFTVVLLPARVEAQSVENGRRIDRWHSWVCTNLVGTARGIDRFFSNDRVLEEENDTRLRVRFGPEFRERSESRMRQRVSLRLDLPNSEDRFSFFFEDIADDVLDVMMGEADEDGVRTGFRFKLLKSDCMHTDLSASGRVSSGELDPYIRLRTRWTFPLMSWIIEPTQFFFWRRLIGFGERSRLDLIRPLGERKIFRLRSQATWAEEPNGVEWRIEPSYFHRLRNSNGFRLACSVDGITRPVYEETVYEIRADWRQRLYSDWLFLETGPDVRWERERNFKSDIGFRLFLEINAGR